MDLNEYIDRVLESLEPSAADLADHDCSQHPTITHKRWLQCQHEIRAMLAGTPDPEFDAYYRRQIAEHHRRADNFRRTYK